MLASSSDWHKLILYRLLRRTVRNMLRNMCICLFVETVVGALPVAVNLTTHSVSGQTMMTMMNEPPIQQTVSHLAVS